MTEAMKYVKQHYPNAYAEYGKLAWKIWNNNVQYERTVIGIDVIEERAWEYAKMYIEKHFNQE